MARAPIRPAIVAPTKSSGLMRKMNMGRRVYSVCHANTNAQSTKPQKKNKKQKKKKKQHKNSVCHANTNAQSTKPQKKIAISGNQTGNGRLSHSNMLGNDATALAAAAMAAAVTTDG